MPSLASCRALVRERPSPSPVCAPGQTLTQYKRAGVNVNRHDLTMLAAHVGAYVDGNSTRDQPAIAYRTLSKAISGWTGELSESYARARARARRACVCRARCARVRALTLRRRRAGGCATSPSATRRRRARTCGTTPSRPWRRSSVLATPWGLQLHRTTLRRARCGGSSNALRLMRASSSGSCAAWTATRTAWYVRGLRASRAAGPHVRTHRIADHAVGAEARPDAAARRRWRRRLARVRRARERCARRHQAKRRRARVASRGRRHDSVHDVLSAGAQRCAKSKSAAGRLCLEHGARAAAGGRRGAAVVRRRSPTRRTHPHGARSAHGPRPASRT
jgi:hypothetical protein